MDTLERIEDRENVVGGHPKGAVGKEGKTPCDTQQATQSHDSYNAWATCVILCFACVGSLETEEPGHCDDKSSKGEDEDHHIVAYVDNVVGVIVSDPAPWDRKKTISKGTETWLYCMIVQTLFEDSHGVSIIVIIVDELFAIFPCAEQGNHKDTR